MAVPLPVGENTLWVCVTLLVTPTVSVATAVALMVTAWTLDGLSKNTAQAAK